MNNFFSPLQEVNFIHRHPTPPPPYPPIPPLVLTLMSCADHTWWLSKIREQSIIHSLNSIHFIQSELLNLLPSFTAHFHQEAINIGESLNPIKNVQAAILKKKKVNRSCLRSTNDILNMLKGDSPLCSPMRKTRRFSSIQSRFGPERPQMGGLLWVMYMIKNALMQLLQLWAASRTGHMIIWRGHGNSSSFWGRFSGTTEK